jgi:phosphate transport system substrate-binding protein
MKMNNKSVFLIIFVVGIGIAVTGCQGERLETPTKGHVTVLVSESVAPLLRSEEIKFEELYPEAQITAEVTSDREAITRLFNDSITIVVTARSFNSEELEAEKRFNLGIHEYKIAIDGIVVITNNENPVTQLRVSQLDSVLTGDIQTWDKLGWKGSTSNIIVYLPEVNSATHEVIATKVLQGEKYLSHAKQVMSSPEMIQSVVKDPSGIGLVGMNWLADRKEQVRMLELCDTAAPDSLGIQDKYFGPHQAYVYQRYYPLTREVFIYSRADNYGVAAGFTSFITSVAGQKIVQNSGLVPATMPVRLVEVTNKSL